ncbi:GNAT family N-acetyltransferase [Plantactinospora sp. B24E8]|uniref:GNAT family N-acetyltransferase n=1 Tax=Plantactinospora sp. B24E8 TaxID=3153567 RepID=UPI00325EB90A
MRRDVAGAADLPALYGFAQRIWSPGGRWHVGELAWNLGQVPDGRPEWPMALWEADGSVLAWGWVVRPEDELSLLVDPARPDLVDEVLDWAGTVTTGPLTVTVLDTERHLVAALLRRGHTADHGGTFLLAHRRDLDELPPVPRLPAGLTVRPVRGEADLVRRTAVHREVWHPSQVTEERFRNVSAGWPYRGEFDMVVEAPDGRFLAYCLGWYDEVNRVGVLEPVGTLAEFRGQGLARATIEAVLRAFREAGARTALVSSRGDDDYPVPRQVYAALGFTPYARTVRYRRR